MMKWSFCSSSICHIHSRLIMRQFFISLWRLHGQLPVCKHLTFNSFTDWTGGQHLMHLSNSQAEKSHFHIFPSSLHFFLSRTYIFVFSILRKSLCSHVSMSHMCVCIQVRHFGSHPAHTGERLDPPGHCTPLPQSQPVSTYLLTRRQHKRHKLLEHPVYVLHQTGQNLTQPNLKIEETISKPF